MIVLSSGHEAGLDCASKGHYQTMAVRTHVRECAAAPFVEQAARSSDHLELEQIDCGQNMIPSDESVPGFEDDGVELAYTGKCQFGIVRMFPIVTADEKLAASSVAVSSVAVSYAAASSAAELFVLCDCPARIAPEIVYAFGGRVAGGGLVSDCLLGSLKIPLLGHVASALICVGGKPVKAM